MSRVKLLIEDLTSLLREEIATIKQGQFDRIEGFVPRKLDLMEKLDAKSEVIEAALKDGDRELQMQVTELQSLLGRNRSMLERMTEATGTMVQELSRIRDRHGMGGIYNAEGQTRPSVATNPQHLDRSV
jgi:hypothetical protein